jgi:hypothetical protein
MIVSVCETTAASASKARAKAHVGHELDLDSPGYEGDTRPRLGVNVRDLAAMQTKIVEFKISSRATDAMPSPRRAAAY